MVAHTKITHSKNKNRARRVAAFFDLDHTLLNTNCGAYFGWYLVKRLRAPPRAILHFFFGGLLYLFYLYSPESFLRKQVQYLRGISVAEFTTYADQIFAQDPERFFRPEVVQRYRWHQQQGHKVFIITQSYDLLAQYFARVLTPDAVVSTQLEIKRGIFTGNARFCTSHTKHRVVLGLADKYGLDLSKSYAYTDSIHDIKMLRLVGNVIVVNPKIRLSSAAKKRGWKILKVRRMKRVRMGRTGHNKLFRKEMKIVKK